MTPTCLEDYKFERFHRESSLHKASGSTRWIAITTSRGLTICFNYDWLPLAQNPDRMPKLIPNSRKPKLPQFLSYPVGFEKLAAMFDDTKEPEVRIVFSSPSSEIIRNIRTQTKYPIIEASFINRDAGASASRVLEDYGFYGPKTELRVYAVDRKHRADAIQLLLLEGFNRVKQWLTVARAPTWGLSRHSFTVLFVPNESRLEYEEDSIGASSRSGLRRFRGPIK